MGHVNTNYEPPLFGSATHFTLDSFRFVVVCARFAYPWFHSGSSFNHYGGSSTHDTFGTRLVVCKSASRTRPLICSQIGLNSFLLHSLSHSWCYEHRSLAPCWQKNSLDLCLISSSAKWNKKGRKKENTLPHLSSNNLTISSFPWDSCLSKRINATVKGVCPFLLSASKGAPTDKSNCTAAGLS